MPILRDVIARMGMDFDGTGFGKAEKSVGGLKSSLGKLGALIGLTGVAIGGMKLINLASDAQETMNVVNTSFGENSEAVQKWAAQFANDAKRSEFAMREMAATMGAVLNPLMERNKAAAAEMSTTLAALAVDLGSFFNATDEEAIRALKSGIIGQIEPLQKFGIVMTQANLQAFALEQGIRGDVKAMSSAEKTSLRYQYILANTVDAQGDAAKTALGWANATKGLMAGLKDLGTNIGMVMLPAAEGVLNWASNLVRGFSALAKETNIIQAALMILGAIAAAVAVKMLIAWGPIILKFLLIAAAIAAAALILEDFISFMQGKKSVIGDFINLIAGPGSAEEAAGYLREAWAGLKMYMSDTLLPSLSELGNAFTWLKTDIEEAAQGIWNNIKEYIGPAIDLVSNLANWLLKVGKAAGEFLGIDVDKLKEDFKSMLPSGSDVITGILTGIPGLAIKKLVEKGGIGLPGAEEAGASRFAKENKAFSAFTGDMTKKQRAKFGKLSGEQQEAVFARVKAKAEGGAKNIQQTVTQEIKIELKTSNKIDRAEADRLAEAVQRKVGKENKAAMKALTQRAE